ncbi:GGDEF domain-containing protein, partial [Piscinibacter sp.]|uniref:GGDEF domain-containing protein n=1 Tax=Piscinibacter sp. TaxID=1903157 RepID=UPI002BB3B11F
WLAGDARSPSRFLRMGLGFAFDAQLPLGRSQLFVRAESINSAALALRLIPLGVTGKLEGAAQHWLGLVHGFLLALVAAYGLLWLALRESNLLRYVVYVGSYLYMHLAYSGLAAREVWPDSPAVARFAILIGMTLFSSAGLWFARGFLGLAEIAPRLDRVVAWIVRIALTAMAACVIADSAVAAVDLAFAYIMLFTFLMVGLGVIGVRHGRDQAPVFLAATLLSMAGALVTTLAVMGRLPFSDLTFRAVEVGVMVEAAIWALALGLRLRRQQRDRATALELASRDPLTGLYNRRGFLDQALPVFSTSARGARPLAVVMIDIDHFKRINDVHGHHAGDRTLVAVADRLRSTCRRGDIVARWGGEEFVMLLPETDGDQAHALAERLREVFAGTVVALEEGGSAHFTASFGVAVRSEATTLDDVLRASDAALYAAKDAGRDRVVSTAGAFGAVFALNVSVPEPSPGAPSRLSP